MPILLTSTGLSFNKPRKAFLNLINFCQLKNALVITTAAHGKSRNKYSILARNQLREIGFGEVAFCDIEKIKNLNLSKVDLVYVCGGNTFRLMKAINESNFRLTIKKFINKSGLYIGVSAGSIVMGHNIEIASFGDSSDENKVGLEDLSGLGFTKYAIFPHYNPRLKKSFLDFVDNLNYKVKVIPDDGYILIK